jgi:DNA topoisomerase I
VNIGEDAKIPICPVPGFAWGAVQHDPGVSWLSTWKENVANMNKYAQLSASSSFKGKSDKSKYDKAMKLKGYIGAIRRDYEAGLRSNEKVTRQLATAMWFIDKLALRVGGEKDAGEEADTVGCCTLRVEHLTFGTAEGSQEVELEFLGKDSMLFKQLVDFDSHGDIGRRVFENLRAFCRKRRGPDQVFQEIDPVILNKHLQSLMPGLSAKVFRTYNASETLQLQLPTGEALAGMELQAKVCSVLYVCYIYFVDCCALAFIMHAVVFPLCMRQY